MTLPVYSIYSRECQWGKNYYRILIKNQQKRRARIISTRVKLGDGEELQVNGNVAKKPSPSVTKEEDKRLKVGDKVIYVGKKYRESSGNQVMEVVKISVHWTGNQVTCSYDKGWTTWLTESSLKKVKPEKDHD